MNHTRTFIRCTVMYALVALLVTHTTSCSKPTKEVIIGKWKHSADSSIMEFFDGGTISGATSDGEVLTGNYSRLDETRIKVEFGGIAAFAGAQVWTVEVDGSELKISMEGTQGGTALYHRYKN